MMGFLNIYKYNSDGNFETDCSDFYLLRMLSLRGCKVWDLVCDSEVSEIECDIIGMCYKREIFFLLYQINAAKCIIFYGKLFLFVKDKYFRGKQLNF